MKCIKKVVHTLYAGIIRFRFLGYVLSHAKKAGTPDNGCKDSSFSETSPKNRIFFRGRWLEDFFDVFLLLDVFFALFHQNRLSFNDINSLFKAV